MKPGAKLTMPNTRSQPVTRSRSLGAVQAGQGAQPGQPAGGPVQLDPALLHQRRVLQSSTSVLDGSPASRPEPTAPLAQDRASAAFPGRLRRAACAIHGRPAA
jgi:hypothetical protein